MDFDVFILRVSSLVRKSNEGVPEPDHIKVRFYHDPDEGKHYASCSDGTVISGFQSSLRITVKFGSDHQAMAAI